MTPEEMRGIQPLRGEETEAGLSGAALQILLTTSSLLSHPTNLHSHSFYFYHSFVDATVNRNFSKRTFSK